jgi:hypothetical protein
MRVLCGIAPGAVIGWDPPQPASIAAVAQMPTTQRLKSKALTCLAPCFKISRAMFCAATRSSGGEAVISPAAIPSRLISCTKPPQKFGLVL